MQAELNRLNPAQREAVTTIEGPLLVLAGAGSGKTRVITMRTAHMVSKGIPPESIVAVTFTNKAAGEMQKRIQGMLGGGRQRRPVISTFHSLCLNILRREIETLGYAKNFTVYDTGEQVSLLRHLLSDISVYGKSFRPEAILEKISRMKNGMANPPAAQNGQADAATAAHSGNPGDDDKDFDVEAFSELLMPRYQETMRSLNVVDFDDLLALTVRLFRQYPDTLEKYRRRFQYLMVDEYQDTNKVQFEIIKLLAGSLKNVCVVGDDDQSIYGWRGASLHNILDFEKHFPGAKVVRLEQNYRSMGNILKAANGVIKNNKKRMDKTLRTDRGDGPKVSYYRALDGEEEARWIAEKIAELHLEKNIPYQDVAVIYRANTLSKPFEEAFRANRTPYTVVGGTSYFERKEIKDLAAYLKVMVNPSDGLSLLRASSVPKRGIGAGAAEKLAGFAKEHAISLFEAFKRAGEAGLSARAAGAAADFIVLIEKYTELFKKAAEMGNTLKALVEEVRLIDYISGVYKTPEMAALRIGNVGDFIESLSRYASGVYETEGDAISLQGFLEETALDGEAEKHDKEEEKPFGVTLTTFHSAKGLEFPVVFITCLEEDMLPHKKSSSGLPGEGIEEERRLFYVGITRAMKVLYLTCAMRRMKYGKSEPYTPSRFIGEIPGDVIRQASDADIDPAETGEEKENREKARANAFFSRMKEMLGD